MSAMAFVTDGLGFLGIQFLKSGGKKQDVQPQDAKEKVMKRERWIAFGLISCGTLIGANALLAAFGIYGAVV